MAASSFIDEKTNNKTNVFHFTFSITRKLRDRKILNINKLYYPWHANVRLRMRGLKYVNIHKFCFT